MLRVMFFSVKQLYLLTKLQVCLYIIGMSKLFLEKIVMLAGGQASLAGVLATKEEPIKQAHVWNWLNVTVNGIPERHVIKACAAVNWQVTPHELRPDIYPHPDDGLPDHLRTAA
jgi:DNA-binding transcriptional regulator YdaS (Cro superfamily)